VRKAVSSGVRVPASLAVILLSAQTLLVGATAAAVAADARICQTIAAGETLAAALYSYRAVHGRLPERLVELVPKYLGEVPSAAYGNGEWLYEPTIVQQETDARVHFDVDLAPPERYGPTRRQASAFELSVKRDRSNGPELRRRTDGCWQWSQFSKCLRH
jgi:hypothetical protein